MSKSDQTVIAIESRRPASKPRRRATAMYWALAVALGLASACTLGGGDDGDSPYDHAGITAPSGPGVADGATPVTVDITGRIGARLTLGVSDGARFDQPDANQTAEKTVFLEDDGSGAGKDTVRVIASKPGTVRLYFKVDPLYDPEVIDFLPVRFTAGPARPTAYLPGVLVQEACVAVNSARGRLTTAGYLPPDGSTVDAGDNVDAGYDQEWFKVGGEAFEIGATPPVGLTCPTEAADAIGWVGYVRLEYRSASGEYQTSLTYRTSEQVALATAEVTLSGADFPGYTISAEPDPATPTLTDSFAFVTLALAYQPVADLTGAIAKDVTIAQRFVPEPGPDLQGSSSGGPGSPVMTSADGHVTLFFSIAEAGAWAWYVTPTGGQPTRLPDLVLDGAAVGDGDGDGDF